MDMGIHPGFLPGYVKSTDKPENDILKKITGGDIKGLLVFGEDPLVEMDNLKYLNSIEFLLVQDLVMTHTAREADIVLPASSYIESSGTYTGCDRTINRVTQIFPPKSGQKNWEILCRLAGAFPGEYRYTDEKQIFNEIKETNRFYNGTDIGQRWGGAGFATGEKINLPDRKFLPCQVKMSTYLPQNPTLIWSENFFKNKIKNKLVL
jgi:predicted molibdopterin-dependent oxidoreductase YjgC